MQPSPEQSEWAALRSEQIFIIQTIKPFRSYDALVGEARRSAGARFGALGLGILLSWFLARPAYPALNMCSCAAIISGRNTNSTSVMRGFVRH